MSTIPEATNIPPHAEPPRGGKIYTLIPEVMKRVGTIAKSHHNRAMNYSFQSVDDMYSALQPIMAELGLSAVPHRIVEQKVMEQPRSQGGTMIHIVATVEYRFYAADGSYIAAQVLAEAADYSDKAAPKAMTSGIKYAFKQVFCISSGDRTDTEYGNPTSEPQPQQQPAQIQPTTTGGVTIAAVTVKKQGQSAKGPWTIWAVTDSNGTVYDTFDEGLSALAKSMMEGGRTVEIRAEQNKYGYSLQDILIADAESAPPAEGPGVAPTPDNLIDVTIKDVEIRPKQADGKLTQWFVVTVEPDPGKQLATTDEKIGAELSQIKGQKMGLEVKDEGKWLRIIGLQEIPY